MRTLNDLIWRKMELYNERRNRGILATEFVNGQIAEIEWVVAGGQGKVWCVLSCVDYEGNTLETVCSTKDKAEQFIKENKSSIHCDSFIIQEWEIDKGLVWESDEIY